MRLLHKELYALEAMMTLAGKHSQPPTKIGDIAVLEQIPQNFLELILLHLRDAHLVESSRGVNGGYRLKRAPAEISLGDILRTIGGPMAPDGKPQFLRRLLGRDERHRALHQVLVDAHNASAAILDRTSLADLPREVLQTSPARQ
jgi:Rrf2 family protein